MKRRIFTGAAFLVFAMLLSPHIPAEATPITFELNYEFSGGQSPAASQSPAWLTATFEDISRDVVQLTMSATNLTGSENVKNWLFNISPSLDSQIGSLIFTSISGLTASVTKGADFKKAGGDSHFDINFLFPLGAPANRFTTGKSSVYQISGIVGLTAESFNVVSEDGVYHSAAHVQNTTGVGTGGSGWIGDGGPPAVPEPATMFLLGSGLIGIGVFARKRFKK